MGYFVGATFITTTLAASSFTSVYSIVLPVGSWMLLGNLSFPSSSTYVSLSISSTNNTTDLNAATLVSGAGLMGLQVTRYLIVTSGTQTWYLVAGNAGAGQTATNSGFTATRIG